MFKFIRHERIYILMVIFILAMNLLAAHRQGKDTSKALSEDKKTLSTMTFEEMGITEQKVRGYLDSDRFSARFFRYSIVMGFLLFGLSLLLNLWFIFTGKRIDFKRPIEMRSVSWGISDLIKVSIIIIFLAYIISLAESFIFGFFHMKLGLNLRMMLNTFFIDIAAALILFYFVIIKCRERLQNLGLRFSHFLSDILTGITMYLLVVPLLLVTLLVSVWILNTLKYTPPPQPVFDIFIEERRHNVLFFLTVFVSLLGPIVEEIFFRGFMYSAVRKRIGITAAALLTGAAFSLLHTNIVGFLPIMVLGVLLAYLYETTGSLVASITVHVIHNSIIVAFVFFIKQLI